LPAWRPPKRMPTSSSTKNTWKGWATWINHRYLSTNLYSGCFECSWCNLSASRQMVPGCLNLYFLKVLCAKGKEKIFFLFRFSPLFRFFFRFAFVRLETSKKKFTNATDSITLWLNFTPFYSKIEFRT
jgi:hypothetical protein